MTYFPPQALRMIKNHPVLLDLLEWSFHSINRPKIAKTRFYPIQTDFAGFNQSGSWQGEYDNHNDALASVSLAIDTFRTNNSMLLTASNGMNNQMVEQGRLRLPGKFQGSFLTRFNFVSS